MASKRFDPKSTDYPTSLKDAYGFSDDQIQQLKDRGVTLGDLQSINILGPPQMATPGQGGGGTIGGQVISDVGKQQQQSAAMLKLMLGQQQQPQAVASPAPSAPTGATVMNPLQLPSQQVQTPQVPQPVPQPALPPIQQPVIQAPQQQPLGSNVLNPIPVPLAPVQQYGSGGLVQRYQSGGMVNSGSGGQVQQIAPGITRNAQGAIVYTDPALQTQLGLGDLSTSQQTSLGLDPYHSQALSGATQVGAQYAPYFLGAAALNMPAVINLPPSGTPSSKSGVAPTPGAIVGNAVPQTPQGPWLTNPSLFARATPYTPTPAPTVTPQTPATAVPYAPGQAFATPPAQPGYTMGSTPPPAPSIQPRLPAGFGPSPQGMGYVPQGWQQPAAGPPPAPVSAPAALQTGAPPQAFLQAHTSALADAGKALYAHFGGDPNSASPADIVNFHSQLTGAVGQHIAGANQGSAGVKQAATGGLVPGQGNKDTVPALLTPGEYVIPKEQVAQLAARGVLRLQSGGLVQDPDPDPPEARRQPLTTASQSSSSSAQSSSPQVGGGRNLVSGLSQAAQTYGSSMSGGMGGGGRMGAGGMGGGYSADTLGKLGDEGLIGSMGLGQGFGGGGLSSAGAQSALGGVASGLGQAAQAIASSVKPWQMQQSAIPDPSQLPKYQTPTLQPERVA